MALVSAGTPILYPMPLTSYAATAALTTRTINTIGHGVACIFQPGIDDTITHVYFRSGAVNAGTIDIRIETVDPATGLPSGTLWATNTSASRVMLSTDDNTYFEVALTAGAVVNKEEWVAIVVQAATASVGAVAYTLSSGATISYGPYHATNTGTWGLNGTASIAILTPKFSNAGYTHLDFFLPTDGTATRTFNNTSTPDVMGNKITVPFKCRVAGCHVLADFDGDATVKLFASDGSTLLASVAVDSEVIGGTTGITRVKLIFDAATDLDAGDVVYLVVEPSTATDISVYDMTFLNSDLKGVYCANAVSVSAKDPTSSSDYTESALEINMIGLLISHIDDGSGIMPNAGLHPIEQGIST